MTMKRQIVLTLCFILLSSFSVYLAWQSQYFVPLGAAQKNGGRYTHLGESPSFLPLISWLFLLPPSDGFPLSSVGRQAWPAHRRAPGHGRGQSRHPIRGSWCRSQ